MKRLVLIGFAYTRGNSPRTSFAMPLSGRLGGAIAVQDQLRSELGIGISLPNLRLRHSLSANGNRGVPIDARPVRRKRPRCRRAAHKRDELAPFQLIELHPLSQTTPTAWRRSCASTSSGIGSPRLD